MWPQEHTPEKCFKQYSTAKNDYKNLVHRNVYGISGMFRHGTGSMARMLMKWHDKVILWRGRNTTWHGIGVRETCRLSEHAWQSMRYSMGHMTQQPTPIHAHAPERFASQYAVTLGDYVASNILEGPSKRARFFSDKFQRICPGSLVTNPNSV